MSGAPLSYLSAAGRRAATILPLTWFTLVISILVCLIIAVLLWQGLRRACANGGAVETRAVEVGSGTGGESWISIGLLISAVPLLATLVWTMVAIAATTGPPAHPALTLDVTGHQWWWEVRYNASQPDQSFETANEIHIPVGVPVLIRLHGGDVIHSFWVPALTGKTDTIPGQTNFSWIEARAPGRYRGQCTEFCGFQHAHMGFEVVAQPQADFERWRAAQITPARAPQSAAQHRGLAVVEYRCGLCHEIRGTQAGALAAPDLTHLMSRRTLAAGLVPNTPGNLAGWIQNAQEMKPGSLMPNQYLPGDELADVEAYLESLQ